MRVPRLNSLSARISFTAALITVAMVAASVLCLYLTRCDWLLVHSDADPDLFTVSFHVLLRDTVVAIVAAVVILYAAVYFVVRRMMRPVNDFTDTALEISRGNLDVPIPDFAGNSEMQRMHDSFCMMQQSIKRYTRDLEESVRQRALLMGELQIAGRIQDDLLAKTFPPFPDRDDVNIRAVLIPAKEIGGDLYNYLIHDDKLYFIIADVSGKSVPAAIVMAVACSVFNTVAPMSDDPAVIVSELNQSTCSNNSQSGFFITALVGILELRTHELRLCNAGHDPAVLVSPAGEVSLLRITPNLPVGVVRDFEYQGVSMILAPGSRLVLYTDGITNSENSRHEFFGQNRLLECVDFLATDEITDFVDGILQRIDEFVMESEQADDFTIMVIDFSPSDVIMPGQMVLGSDIDELNKVNAFADAISQALAFNEMASMRMHLALEEAVSNILRYSLSQIARRSVKLYASVHANCLKVIISDIGKAFDPTGVDDADTDAPIDQRPIGGLGITLMRNISKSMSYKRLNDRNYLHLDFDVNSLRDLDRNFTQN